MFEGDQGNYRKIIELRVFRNHSGASTTAMGYLVRAYKGFVGLVNTDMYLWSLNIFLQINVRTRKLEYKKPGALEFYIWVLMRRNDFFYI